MVTNKKHLPETFVTVLERDYHQSANYSASQMTKPVRMVHLEKRHKKEVVEDVTDKIWALFGTAVHAVLQGGETENQLIEEYLKEEVGGVTISGMSDLYANKKISDYKVTSTWTYIYLNEKLPDYESQLNIYGWLFRKAGFPVEELEIVMILRDWTASKAKYDSQYPDCQVMVIPIRLWSMEKTEKYLKAKIALYERFKNVPDNKLPYCTPAERWAKPPKFAVKKKTRKTALRVLNTYEEATAYMEQKGGDFIEERPGEMWKRCEYCSVRPFCNQYQEGSNGHLPGSRS